MSMSPATALILGVGISILIDLYIAPGDYSIYEWYNVMYSFFITLIPMYLPGALSRYIAVTTGGGDSISRERLVKTSSILCLTLVPFSGISAFFLTPLIFEIIGIGSSYAIIDSAIFAVGIMCINLSSFTESVAGAFQEFDKLGIGRFIANIIGQVSVIVLILFGIGIQALLLKFVLVSIISVIFLSLTVKQIWSLKGERYPLKPLILFSYPSTISYLFAYFLNEILVRAILQSYSTSGMSLELGLFGFAVRIAAFVNALTLGFYGVIGPYYANAFGQGNTKALENEIQWTLKMSLLIFMPLVVGAISIAPATFLILFPERYYWSYQVFMFLVFQIFLFLLQRPLYYALGAVGKVKTRLVCSVSSSVLSAIIMVLVSSQGSILVVIAYVSSTFLEALFLVMSTKREIRINLGIRRAIPIIIISFFTLGPAVFIHFLRLNPFVELFLIVCDFALIYFSSIRILNLVSEEEILKATLFLPTKLANFASSLLIKLLVRKKVT